MKSDNRFGLFVLSQLFVLALTAVFWLAGASKTAQEVVGWGGAGVVMLGWVAYIVFFHSRSRWPDAAWTVRLGRLLTYYSGPRTCSKGWTLVELLIVIGGLVSLAVLITVGYVLLHFVTKWW